jgi:uncharacterized delta-60 repeat protein
MKPFPRSHHALVLGRRVAALLVGLVVATGWTPAARAAGGALDPTFDGDGKVLTDFARFGDNAHAVAIQADGAIVAAGGVTPSRNAGTDFGVARYLANGSLDTTFDADGRASTDFAGGGDAPRGVAIQPDGKIVVVGFAYGGKKSKNDFGLVRYNANGSLDTTFGAGGKVRTAMNAAGDDQANAVALQQDGKIVVAGTALGDFLLARYNADGSLDTTFGSGGRVQIGFAPAGVDDALAVAIQSDGRIVAGGYASGGTTSRDFALARCLPDGSLDATGFGAGGTARLAVSSQGDEIEGIALQPTDGAIVAAGYAFTAATGTSNFALARFTASGVLDPTFGAGGADGDGIVTTTFGPAGAPQTAEAYAMAIQPRVPAPGDPDQDTFKIVAAGQTLVAQSGSAFALARYGEDGTLDASFGSNGLVQTKFSTSGSDTCRALAVDASARIVAAGRADGSQSTDFALARYD